MAETFEIFKLETRPVITNNVGTFDKEYRFDYHPIEEQLTDEQAAKLAKWLRANMTSQFVFIRRTTEIVAYYLDLAPAKRTPFLADHLLRLSSASDILLFEFVWLSHFLDDSGTKLLK